MKFKGDFGELQAKAASTGIKGTWSDAGPNHKVFRTDSGALLNWWPSKGTLLCQGPPQECKQLEAAVQAALAGQCSPASLATAPPPGKPQIFVVHGHDTAAREQLELILHKLGLPPFVLINTAGEGLTIIEALEKRIGREADATFGIVLMTPDDFGYSKRDGEKAVQARARQNVILEMGMLLASLTRPRVAILVKGHIEQPSDAAGVIYLHFNDHVKEVVPRLAERLQTCGIRLTAEQIARASS